MSQITPKSRLLDYFVKNQKTLKKEAKLIGDILLVEPVKFPEAKVGSILLASAPLKQLDTLLSDQPSFYRVLHVGVGYYDEVTGKDVPLDVKPGYIVLLPAASTKFWSHFPMLEIAESKTLGMARMSDVQWYWESEEAFFNRLADLNQAVKTKVPTL